MNKTTMIKIGSVMVVLISFFVLSCEKDSPTKPKPTFFETQGEKGFVGTVDGTDAFISLLISSDEGIVYVCNGDEEIAEWFRGELKDPKNVNLANGSGAEIIAQFNGKSFDGNVTLRNDNTFSFSAIPNTAEDAGIYRVYGTEAKQDEIEAGWILNSDGDERGSLRIGTSFRKNGPRIKDVLSGTTNTALISGRSYPVWSFSVVTTLDSVSIFAP
jgi:hypothetical protein